MPLPILESPKYILTVPSTKKSIEYRPFLVKEEKILLLAQETGDDNAITQAIKEIIKACTFGVIDPEDLTTFDLEYIFLKLRAKSVGEISEINCTCEKCSAKTPVSIDIDKIEVTWPKDYNPKDNTIMLTDTVGVTMQYLKVRDIKAVNESKSQTETIMDTIIAMINTIFDQNGVYKKSDSTQEELLTFINSLSRSQIEKIEKFIIDSPKLMHELDFSCIKCKHTNKVTLAGTQSFFE